MRFYRAILLPVLAVMLAAYAFDCGAAMTSEQAMECCKSMPCSPQGHSGQDCCATMPSMHAPFAQDLPLQGASFPAAMFALLPAFSESDGVDSSAVGAAERSHAPPGVFLSSSLPLRI